jgi:GT2 family glycosyltransferase
VIYGDEAGLRRDGALEAPWFKPDWNNELFLALDYLSSAVAIRADIAQEAARIVDAQANDPLLALSLRATELAGDQVFHLNDILVHVDRTAAHRNQSRMHDVQRHLGDRGKCLDGPYGTVHVQWPLPKEEPLVSLIIPTRDKLDLLRCCIESIETHTSYRNYELVIVDNGSVEQTTLDYLEGLRRQLRVHVIRSDAPYNYSALNNRAVRDCAGQFLLLLNNDTEVISPEWLTEMMRYAVRSDVGAVGAKLVYDDGSLQHAGVVVGLGEAAGHAHRNLPVGDSGYFRQPHAAQFVSAVSAACLLVSREHYESVGGLDEDVFAIAFNDVDFCLKLREAGLHNVYTPHAVLYHYESRSRGDDLSDANRQRYMRELAALQERWNTKTHCDPLHHRQLDRYSETFVPDYFRMEQL